MRGVIGGRCYMYVLNYSNLVVCSELVLHVVICEPEPSNIQFVYIQVQKTFLKQKM